MCFLSWFIILSIKCQKMVKNAHHVVPESKLTSKNVQKGKGTQRYSVTMIWNRGRQKILIFKMREPDTVAQTAQTTRIQSHASSSVRTSVGLILWAPWMPVQHFIQSPLRYVSLDQKWRADSQTDIVVPGATLLAWPKLKVESLILESPDRSKLHSENKHFKSCLLVVLKTDLTESASWCSYFGILLIAIKSQQNLFILGSYCCSKPD